MKKSILILSSLFLTMICFAGQADLFDVDEQAINQEFSNLTQLENYVSQNNNISLEEIAEQNSFDLNSVNVNTFSTTGQGGAFMFAWDGFLWGFLCCPIGFFVMAINDDASYDQKISYWIGFGAAVVLSTVFGSNYYFY